MASRRIDSEIDRLYELPPDAFTAARNALAKEAGAEGAEIRRLSKPPIAAWAVNQVHWKERAVYDALIASSTELRARHKAVLAGRRADIREATKAHEEAVDAALKAALGALRAEGHPVTDSTRQSVLTTLRSLPADDPPGRLTRVLQPGGFEALAGLSIAAPAGGVRTLHVKPAPPKEKDSKAAAKAKVAEKETAHAKARREAAARAVREAEQEARRTEFEAVRLTREADKAARQVERAREALETAREELERAEEESAAAARRRDAAVERARDRDRALEAAREKAGRL